MKLDFWKDNKIEGHHQVTVEQIVSDFKQSEEFKNYEAGAMLDRCLLNFMSNAYGTFDRLEGKQWNKIHTEFNKQTA